VEYRDGVKSTVKPAGTLKMLDVKMTDQLAGHEIAGHENAGMK